ncbi:TetR/AcrR family transcriptional regulator [Acerihabitans sp. KWT182]|uniref:TetR/AcrR family transcriptional regulator n=1 Tax=Acerihabitans sp. KWT182 TaxID=3157919 RepID=A0AAU7Q8K6_9GAMM
MSKQQRIEERRDQIIDAARICFSQHGFHGAGMAEIASLSQLSVGQIYRYFTNKEAIIEEIVRRIVKHRLKLMWDHDNDLNQLADNLASQRLLDGEDAQINQGLMLEIAAEATRNPQVESILCDADDGFFHQGCEMMKRAYPQLNIEQVAALSEMMAVLSAGTAQRMLTRLQQRHVDRSQMKALYLSIFRTLFATRPWA